jgi:tripartite-type tricarboxylate transporter receptor subunit TctC
MKNRKREICTSGSVRDEAGQPPHLLGHRRQFLHLAAGVAALPFAPHMALSQAYPSKPVRVIVPFPAGNASDIVARLIGQRLSERLGQSFVIDNRPGAGGNIGIEAVAKAAADGNTLLLLSPTATISPSLYEKLNFNLVRDTAPVAGVGLAPYVVTLTPSFPAKTVAEFIAYAKANPGKINMASSGTGSLSHMSGELLKSMAGIDMVHVPYRSSFLPDLFSGQVQVAIAPMSQTVEYIRAGTLRALAVTTKTRTEALPDIPTLADFVPGYEVSGWYGIGAPQKTPADIVEKLNKEIGVQLADQKMITQLADVGAIPMRMTTTEFRTFIVAETEKWAKVVKFANIKPD